MEKLQAALAHQKEHLKANSGKHIIMTETGPIGISIIEELVRVVGEQQKQIKALQQRLNARDNHTTPGL